MERRGGPAGAGAGSRFVFGLSEKLPHPRRPGSLDGAWRLCAWPPVWFPLQQDGC